MKTKYEILVSMLDDLCKEAPAEYKRYHPTNKDEVPEARGLAYIHLLLKIRFGLRSFGDREAFITDGANDGGIDAYYISHASHTIYFIQSKFRNTEQNFDGGKNISIEELASMHICEILAPKKTDQIEFNDKIKKMQKKLSEIRDPQLYTKKVIILANLSKSKFSHFSPETKKGKEAINRLLQGFEYEIFNYQKTYEELLLPSISGTCSQPDEVTIPLTLKDNEVPQATNTIETIGGNCTVSIMFIPVMQIAQMMHNYRNALLTYNPRSFLGLRRGTINNTIRNTIVNKDTNEFALFNNGLTIVTSGSSFNKSLGSASKTQLILKDPQIINGGQTAATLAQIYDSDDRDSLESKEVLVRVITFEAEDTTSKAKRKEVIQQLSEATNGQTTITDGDRHANDPLLDTFKKSIFEDFAMLYEHKIGEFYEGVEKGYVKKEQIVDRDNFLQVALAMNGDPGMARSGGKKNLYAQYFFKDEHQMNEREQKISARKYMYGYFVLCYLKTKTKQMKDSQDKYHHDKYGYALRYGNYAVVSVCARFRPNNLSAESTQAKAEQVCESVLSHWKEFENEVIEKRGTDHEFDFANYYKTQTVKEDINSTQIKWLDE